MEDYGRLVQNHPNPKAVGLRLYLFPIDDKHSEANNIPLFLHRAKNQNTLVFILSTVVEDHCWYVIEPLRFFFHSLRVPNKMQFWNLHKNANGCLYWNKIDERESYQLIFFFFFGCCSLTNLLNLIRHMFNKYIFVIYISNFDNYKYCNSLYFDGIFAFKIWSLFLLFNVCVFVYIKLFNIIH